MQITFDPTLQVHRIAVRAMLDALATSSEVKRPADTTVTVKVDASEAVAMLNEATDQLRAETSALSHIPDNSDPAQVFAPLDPGGAPLGAGAAVSASAPEAPQAGAAPSLPEYSPAAAAALPPVSAPAASAPAANPAPGVDVDATGLPWDARIHSTPAKKNADNTWRAKRGLNDGALVASVQAELRQVMAIPNGAAGATPTAPAATAPIAGAPSAPIVPAAPVAPPPAAPQPPAANGHLPDPTTGAELLPRVTAAQLAGAIPPTALLEACTQMGLPSIPMLFTRSDLVPAIWAYLKATHPALG